MDLIYANTQKEDLGIMSGYTLDLAYGVDENNFECTISRDAHCCQSGYILYIEHTEYGGIIDTIGVSTNKKDLIYSGRTWHGILEGKVICPDTRTDYLTVSGEANSILGALIKRLGVSNLFVADTKDSGITITGYRFPRYIKGYSGIRKMLKAFSAKLHVSFDRKCVVLSAVPLIDYSSNDEFDSSAIDFNVTKNYRPVNHLICLGKGDLSARKVIHLFTDENGGIQAYASTEMPLSNADYILDTSAQVLFGENEVVEVYECSNAETTENYVPLLKKPSDWQKNITFYYRQDENGDFVTLYSSVVEEYNLLKKEPYDWDINFSKYYALSGGKYASVTEVSEALYTLQVSEPSDWDKKYANYYINRNGVYIAVEAVLETSLVLTKTKPVDWEKNYSKYLYYWSDGTTSEYKNVSGVSMTEYVLQTMQPSDWEEAYSDYYIYKQVYRYKYEVIKVDIITKTVVKTIEYSEECLANEKEYNFSRMLIAKELVFDGYQALLYKETWKPGKFYTKRNKQIAPPWEADMYYLRSSKNVAPKWESGKYYIKTVQAVPAWVNDTYYEKSAYTVYPDFVNGNYYEKRIDDYADLVSGGLEKLKEYWSTDKIDVDFEPETSFDIGDIVGATESVTGISIRHEVTKKIVKINQGIESITYEIGE